MNSDWVYVISCVLWLVEAGCSHSICVRSHSTSMLGPSTCAAWDGHGNCTGGFQQQTITSTVCDESGCDPGYVSSGGSCISVEEAYAVKASPAQRPEAPPDRPDFCCPWQSQLYCAPAALGCRTDHSYAGAENHLVASAFCFEHRKGPEDSAPRDHFCFEADYACNEYHAKRGRFSPQAVTDCQKTDRYPGPRGPPQYCCYPNGGCHQTVEGCQGLEIVAPVYCLVDPNGNESCFPKLAACKAQESSKAKVRCAEQWPGGVRPK
jgi:hypothetical protein